jgi:hypothetical protein
MVALENIVAKVVNWLLLKASGRNGEVMAVVECQRSLGEVSCC